MGKLKLGEPYYINPRIGPAILVKELDHDVATARFPDAISILTEKEGLFPAHVIMLAKDGTLFADDLMYPNLVRWDPMKRKWEEV